MRSRRAFSLVEVLLVLTIATVVAAIAVPRYAQALARYRAEVAAHRIADDLTLARRDARASGRSRTVVFDVSNDRVTIATIDDLDDPADPYRLDLRESPYEADLLSAGFGGDAQVVFDGYGQADSGGTAVVAVGGNQRTVTLDAATSRVQVN